MHGFVMNRAIGAVHYLPSSVSNNSSLAFSILPFCLAHAALSSSRISPFTVVRSVGRKTEGDDEGDDDEDGSGAADRVTYILQVLSWAGDSTL